MARVDIAWILIAISGNHVESSANLQIDLSQHIVGVGRHQSKFVQIAGRRHDVRGRWRTKSFRLSFLVAYATRMGERLAATSSSVTDELRREARVDGACLRAGRYLSR